MERKDRLLALLIAAVLVVCLLPNMQSHADAASTPVLVLESTTAVNPVLDLVLDYDTYSSGGPFTVSWEWKAVSITDNDPSAVNAACALVSLVGSVYGSMTQQQNDPYIYNWGTTGWIYRSFSFKNVGVYSADGITSPGNLLRFSMWYARGQLMIKNLIIKNAAGTVLYNLNTDKVVQQALSNMEKSGVGEIALSELEAIDDDNSSWRDSQISGGNYAAYLRIEGQELSTDPCAQGHYYQNGYCTKCFAADPSYDPCANGHTYYNGYCVFCLDADPGTCANGVHRFSGGYCMNCFALDPNYVMSSTTVPSTTTPPATGFPEPSYPVNPSVENDKDAAEDEDRKQRSSTSSDTEFLVKIGLLAGGILLLGGGFFIVLAWVKKKQ